MGRMLCEPLSKEVLRHIVRITSSCTVDVMELKRAQRARKPNIIEHTGSILIWQWSRTRSKLEGAALTGGCQSDMKKIGNLKGTFRSASRILKGTSSLPPRFAAPLRWSGRTSSDLSIWIELIRELNWTELEFFFDYTESIIQGHFVDLMLAECLSDIALYRNMWSKYQGIQVSWADSWPKTGAMGKDRQNQWRHIDKAFVSRD